jgi:NADP-dependent 3-hydroxy acid dehydrogenase YdfG
MALILVTGASTGLGLATVTTLAGEGHDVVLHARHAERLVDKSDRAVEVQLLLADRGQHRAPSIPDLLVAAPAEVSGLTVLALDKDFELIAQITGQPIERLRLTM